jgi:hypothetical protein
VNDLPGRFKSFVSPHPKCRGVPTVANKDYDVFLSYCRKDSEIANAAKDLLEQHNIRCWIDKTGLVGGSSWRDVIIRNLDSSRLLILVFTEYSNVSKEVRVELERAFEKDIPIIPWRVRDGFEMSPGLCFLGRFHGIMVQDQPQWVQLDQLLITVQQALQQHANRSEDANDAAAPATRRHPTPVSRCSLLGDSQTLHCLCEARICLGRDWQTVDVLLLPWANTGGDEDEIDAPLFERISRRLLECAWDREGLVITDLRSPEKQKLSPALWGSSPFGRRQRLRDGTLTDQTYEYLLDGVLSVQIVPHTNDSQITSVWITTKWLANDAWNHDCWLLLRPGFEIPVRLTDAAPTVLFASDGIWAPDGMTVIIDGITSTPAGASPLTIGQRLRNGEQSVQVIPYCGHTLPARK